MAIVINSLSNYHLQTVPYEWKRADEEVIHDETKDNVNSEDYSALYKLIGRLIRVTFKSVINEAPQVLRTNITKMRTLHGPHPENAAFFSFLVLSLDHLRFRISLFIMKDFVPREQSPQPDAEDTDLLVKLTKTLQHKDTTDVDNRLLVGTVKELYIRYNINRWLVREETCLLNAVIDCMDPDYRALHLLPPSNLKEFFEFCFESLVRMPKIDLDLKEAARLYPKAKLMRPLEVALRGGRYRAAIVLISRKADVNLVDITGCQFLGGASLAFIYLCLAGYVFPSIEALRHTLKVPAEEEKYFNSFLNWLEAHRSKAPSLARFCLSTIKKGLGYDYLEQLTRTLDLPETILRHVRFGVPKD